MGIIHTLYCFLRIPQWVVPGQLFYKSQDRVPIEKTVGNSNMKLFTMLSIFTEVQNWKESTIYLRVCCALSWLTTTNATQLERWFLELLDSAWKSNSPWPTASATKLHYHEGKFWLLIWQQQHMWPTMVRVCQELKALVELAALQAASTKNRQKQGIQCCCCCCCCCCCWYTVYYYFSRCPQTVGCGGPKNRHG